ncbi:DUF998 domain-containing protein [Nocardia sp. XZ_19_385]|uniref:DUF998 domain-containing protein n=1 Tax=Nocardia sp. XZ_19_385 TaxID=2769488 RepID=UPI00188F43E5|nr:DUF998 domain-containing protein [Nocardia sp. XZ_19_385]
MAEPRTRALLICGAIAGPLFLAAVALEGATRADYDPVRHPISSLALGPYGWTQTATFLVSGILSLAYAVGLRAALTPGRGRLWAPILVAAWGIGLVGSGVFVTDPVSGYPPGTPGKPAGPTTTGTLHDLFALPVFLGFPVLCLVILARFLGERRLGWAVYTLLTAAGFTACFVLASMGFEQDPGLIEIAGLLQRITIAIAWLWLTLLAVHLLRSGRTDSR